MSTTIRRILFLRLTSPAVASGIKPKYIRAGGFRHYSNSASNVAVTYENVNKILGPILEKKQLRFASQTMESYLDTSVGPDHEIDRFTSVSQKSAALQDGLLTNYSATSI